MINLQTRLRWHLLTARSDFGDNHVRVLTDADGHRTAQKLYHKYISEENYSKLPAFVQALDNLLARFGAGKGGGERAAPDDSYEAPKKKKDRPRPTGDENI